MLTKQNICKKQKQTKNVLNKKFPQSMLQRKQQLKFEKNPHSRLRDNYLDSYLSLEQCNTCGVTRNTKHLVLECNKTVLLREGLFNCIKGKKENFMRLNEKKLQYILNMESEKAVVKTYK